MSERSAAGRTPGYGWLAAETAVVFVAYFAFHLWSELKFEGLVGSDGYYHIKLAYLYRTGECSILGGDFPWTQFSSFHRLRHDWQLGYHLLLIPFTLLGLVTGAKVSTACFAALLFAVLYLILRLHRVRFAWLFWLIAVFASSSMALRYHAPRPTPLLVSLFLLYVHFIVRRRSAAASVAGFLAMFVYNVPHSLAVAGGIALVLLAFHDGKVPWRLGGAIAAGLALGVVLHPGFWHWEGDWLSADRATFRLWEQVRGSMETSLQKDVVLVGGEPVKMQLGGEFKALSTRALKNNVGLPLALLFGTLLLIGVRPRKLSLAALTYLTLAGAFFVLFLDHSRFSEYWVPLAVLGCGLSIGPILEELRASPEARWRRAAVALVALACIGTLGWRNGKKTHEILITEALSSTDRYGRAMTWLRENSEPGDVVFHPEWDAFAPMFFHNHANYYLVGFDPYFLYQFDPEKYLLWTRVGTDDLDDAETLEAIRSFGASYVLISNLPTAREKRLRLLRTPGLERVFADKFVTVLRVDAG